MEQTHTDASPDQSLSTVIIGLCKGVVYQDQAPRNWQALLNLQARVRDYVAVLGLELVLDEAEGYAFLRHRPTEDGEADLPRLVTRRQLAYPASLLLALLRKKLAEHDASGGDPRLILSREQMLETMRLFLPDATDDARLTDRVGQDIRRVTEMGFLRQLQGQEEQYEVRRILKSFVDAQWLAELDQRLADYRRHAEAGER